MPQYSGLYNGVYNETHSLQFDRSPINRKIAQALRRRSSTVIREVIDVVAAAVSINGASAVTYKQIAGDPGAGNAVTGGGRRTIETVTKIAASTNTSAAHATEVDSLVDWKTAPGTYVADLSGNGGGGRLSAKYAVNG